MQSAVFVFLLAAGGFFSWEMLLGPVVDVVRARSWVKTPCTIVDSGVASHAPTEPEWEHRDERRLLHSLEIGFRYEVGGKTYTSRRYSFDPR